MVVVAENSPVVVVVWFNGPYNIKNHEIRFKIRVIREIKRERRVVKDVIIAGDGRRSWFFVVRLAE